jgi:hypothetical protein
MDTTEETTPRSEPSPATPPARTGFSAEAIVGTGVTVASTGVLFLLLGWAQVMRGVQPAAWILLVLGAVCVVVGGVIWAAAPRSRKG